MRAMSPPDPRARRDQPGHQPWAPSTQAPPGTRTPPGAAMSGSARPRDMGRRRRSLSRSQMALGVVLIGVILLDIALLLVALVPDRVWQTHGFPNGPIPSALTPLIAGGFYVLPALIGALCRRWQVALVLATLPAWLDMGLFATAAASRIGPFYLFLDVHAASTVGTLELFGALGALGWLGRTVALMALGRGEWGHR